MSDNGSAAIRVTVLDNMQLMLSPLEVGRAGEQNATLFRIVQQPASLDALVCRAEVANAQGTNYRLVQDREFLLTSDIAVAGMGHLQLVYSDGADIIIKTTVANYHVSRSIGAIDPSDPEYENGLAQLQAQAFARAQGNNDGIVFYNISGQGVDNIIYPPAQGGGDLTEERANGLYLRLSGLTPMQGSVGISGPNRGITWEDSGVQGALYSTGTQLVLRLPIGDPPFVIEPNSGAAGLRSPVLTQQAGDTRYLTPSQAETTYARLAGAQFTGPLITQAGTNNTNLGVSIGDNSTGFWRTGTYLIAVMGGQTVWQSNTTEMMLGVRLNMATQPITNVGAPTAAGDAANRGYVDNAVATVPRPNNRTYLTNTVELLNTTTQILLDQLYPVADNSPRTITVTVFPSFQGGTPSAFYDLIYTCSVAPLIEARSTVYPTAGAYMQSPVRFAATVTPVNNSIQVQIVVRLNAQATGALTIVGSGTDRRSYVTIEEQAN